MNKHLIATALWLIFLCPALRAQVGIKGGINLSGIAAEPSDITEDNAILGWQAGLVFKVPVYNWFAFQPEALYIRKGSSYQYAGADVKQRLGYAEFPVLASFNPFGSPLNLQIGPQFSFLTDAKTTFTNGPFGTSGVVDNDLKNYENFDTGLVLGAGLNLGNLLIDLRYTRGFRSVDKQRTIGNTEYGSNAKNFNVQASLGVFF